jgi:hypothetical protein
VKHEPLEDMRRLKPAPETQRLSGKREQSLVGGKREDIRSRTIRKKQMSDRDKEEQHVKFYRIEKYPYFFC